jgi:hypothetical protein
MKTLAEKLYDGVNIKIGPRPILRGSCLVLAQSKKNSIKRHNKIFQRDKITPTPVK